MKTVSNFKPKLRYLVLFISKWLIIAVFFIGSCLGLITLASFFSISDSISLPIIILNMVVISYLYESWITESYWWLKLFALTSIGLITGSAIALIILYYIGTISSLWSLWHFDDYIRYPNFATKLSYWISLATSVTLFTYISKNLLIKISNRATHQPTNRNY